MSNLLSSEEILIKIQQGNPMSLTRYGDGEAIILNGFKDVESLIAVYKRQFGFTPEIEQAQQIRQNLIEAYKNCDVIGCPIGKKIKDKNSYWAKSLGILKANTGIHLKNRLICSIDIHSDFLDKGYFDKILMNVKTLNYISCRDLDDKFKEKYNISVINQFKVSPEAKFSTNTTGEKHYPTQFNRIQRWMDKGINCNGAICLVGAGVVGKIYCNWFRDRGGIAIDIGSVMDSFAGKQTRGADRGFDKEDNTYKL